MKNLHTLIPHPHEVGLSDEENEAYYIGAEAAAEAAIAFLDQGGTPIAAKWLKEHFGAEPPVRRRDWCDQCIDTPRGQRWLCPNRENHEPIT